MNSASNQSPVPVEDSIQVTKLPTQMLMQDLKQLILGHFANFGRIVRISITKVKGVQTAHIQYSSVQEARDAIENGKLMSGYSLLIKGTVKHPPTQPLVQRPVARPSTLQIASASVSSTVSSTSGSSGSQRQASIHSFLNRKPEVDVKERKPEVHVKERKPEVDVKERKPFESKPKITISSAATTPQPSTSTSSSCVSSASDSNHSSRVTSSSGPANLETPGSTPPTTPNTCVKLELYTGTPRASPASIPTPPPTPTSASLPQTPKLVVPHLNKVNHAGFSFNFNQSAGFRARSLKEIFHFDLPRMKVVPNSITTSNAVACQFFTGGANKHPFPLALMFGRAPGTVVLPVSTIVNAIKPGIELTSASLELIYSSLEHIVIKNLTREAASSSLEFEKSFGEVVSVEAENLQEKVVSTLLIEMAETQMELEEDLQIAYEDVSEEILGSACQDIVGKCVKGELQMAKTVPAVAEAHLETLLETKSDFLIKDAARNEFYNEHCKEVVDDLLESQFFDACVNRVADSTLKAYREEERAKALEQFYDTEIDQNVLNNITTEVAQNAIIDKLCEEAFDEMLNYTSSLFIKVLAKNAVAKGVDQTLQDLPTMDNTTRIKSWIGLLPDSQSSMESNYISPAPSSSSSETSLKSARTSSSKQSNNEINIETPSNIGTVSPFSDEPGSPADASFSGKNNSDSLPVEKEKTSFFGSLKRRLSFGSSIASLTKKFKKD